MNVIGDIERLFATSLYPLRVPIAIALVVGFVGLLRLARRHGWLAAARRHPGRTAGMGAVVLAIGLPVAWYLGSPLFIRTELIEPAPVAITGLAVPSTDPATEPAPATAAPAISGAATAAPSDDAPAASAAATAAPAISAPAASAPATAAPAISAPAASAPATAAPARAAPAAPAPPNPTPKPPPEPTPFVPVTLAAGPFHGADDFHFGEGTASIIEVAPGRYTLRFERFSVRNGPDLYVYLSPDPAGYVDGAVELGTLKATDGAFGYELPDGLNPADVASAVIWCKQFAVLFAVAPFEVV